MLVHKTVELAAKMLLGWLDRHDSSTAVCGTCLMLRWVWFARKKTRVIQAASFWNGIVPFPTQDNWRYALCAAVFSLFKHAADCQEQSFGVVLKQEALFLKAEILSVTRFQGERCATEEAVQWPADTYVGDPPALPLIGHRWTAVRRETDEILCVSWPKPFVINRKQIMFANICIF